MKQISELISTGSLTLARACRETTRVGTWDRQSSVLVIIHPMRSDAGRCPQRNPVGPHTLKAHSPLGNTDTKQLVLRAEAAPEEREESGCLHCNTWRHEE